MLFGGVAMFTLGYALLWTGVERFRGNDVTLLEALGLSGAGQTNRVVNGSVDPNTADPANSGLDPNRTDPFANLNAPITGGSSQPGSLLNPHGANNALGG